MPINVKLRYLKYMQKRDELIELEKQIQTNINQTRSAEEYRKLRKKILKMREDIEEIKTKIKKLRKQYEIPNPYEDGSKVDI